MLGERKYRLLHAAIAFLAVAMMLANMAFAGNTAALGSWLFSQHCFSPALTGERAAQVFAAQGLRHDFYDLDPLTAVAPSPATGAPVTPATDRRCEVSFDGAFPGPASSAASDALQREGIAQTAQVPAVYQATQGTALLAARRLNPRKIAVVHVGTRPGPTGTETFLSVERMPLAEAE